MGLKTIVGNSIASHFKHVKTKRDAVKGGHLDLTKTSMLINGDDKLGRRVLWKKAGKTELLSTHKFSKQAGLANYLLDNRLKEESAFSNELLLKARKNRYSNDADVRAAAAYIADDWGVEDYKVTRGLQSSLLLLAKAQQEGTLIE